MKISELTINQYARVTAIQGGDPQYRRRLYAFGFTPGVVFQLLRRAPLGDPLEILIRGMRVCLRQHEAEVLACELLE